MNVRKILAYVLCVLLLLGMTACGAEKDYAPNAGDAVEDGGYITEEESAADAESSSALPENRKLIQTAYIDAETEDLDAVLQQLDARIADDVYAVLDYAAAVRRRETPAGTGPRSNVHNGSAYSGKRYRSADITVRIPAKDLDSFIDKVSGLSNIVSSRKTVEDVTLNYVATESRVKALQAEETRLLELLAKADSLDDLLTVEARLTEVRTELEEVTSALRVLENQVDYATLHLTVSEVTEFTDTTEPETVWQRIGDGFVKNLKGVGTFLENVFVFFVTASPYILLIGVPPLAVFLIIRHSIRKKKQKAAKQQEKE